ncbi:MAG: aminodeoxychorismate synthase, component I, partial [Gemmatimonadota bacterium]
MISLPLVEELRPAPDPLEACERLLGLPHLIFLDSAADPERLGRYSYLTAAPAEVFQSKGVQAGPHALELVRQRLARHARGAVAGLPPFQAGVAGYIGYDWGAVLERLPSPRY